MTSEQLEALKQITGQLGYIAGGTVCVAKFFEWQKAKDKEKSVGISKVLELIEKDKEFQASLEKLEHSDEKQNETIVELKSEHKQIMMLVLDWFKGTKH